MTSREIRELFAYTGWANCQLLGAMHALSPVQLAQPIVSSFPGLLPTVQHLIESDTIWLSRWRGDDAPTIDSTPITDLAVLEQRWADVSAAQRAFLNTIDDADLDRILEYRTRAGEPMRSTLGETLRHWVNHATYHRGQMTTMLRQLGAVPPATDLIRFYRERGAPA